MLMGSCFLLILFHLDVKDLSFGRFIYTGALRFLSIMIFFYHLLALLRLLLPLLLIPPPTIFLKISFATAPIRGPAKPAKSPNGNAPPFCLLLPPICQTPFFIDCLPCGISKQYALFFLLFQSILKSRHHSDLYRTFDVLRSVRFWKKHRDILIENTPTLLLLSYIGLQRLE